MLKNLPVVDFTKFAAPVRQLTELNVARFEAAVKVQNVAVKELVELTESRVKAAAEIKDFDGLVSFVKDQTELAKSRTEKLIDDSKVAVEDAKSYGEDVQKILSEGLKTVNIEVPEIDLLKIAAPARSAA